MNYRDLIKKGIAFSGASVRLIMGAVSAGALLYAGIKKRKGKKQAKS